jgi:PASTA domain
MGVRMKATVNLGRGSWRAVLLAFVFGGSFAATAAATTVSVGQLFTPTYVCAGAGTYLQTGVASGTPYTVPKAGVITSWSFQDGAATVPELKLKVGRTAGTGMYKILAEKKAGAQTANKVNTYHAHIPVKAGDLIGLFKNGGDCAIPTGNNMDSYVGTGGDVAPGTTTSFGPGVGYKFPVSVKVALDCVVPNLKGKTLKAAKQALKANSCTLGTVTGPRTGTVKSQKPAPGKTLKPGAKVNVRLG